jgi:hypothetical protein
MLPRFLQSETLPYASVAIVRADQLTVPVVICAWHTSVPELVALQRQFPGQVTHALCAPCAVRFAKGGR